MSPIRSTVVALALSALSHAPLASAVGLGEIHLHSALAEPLKAEIELLDASDIGADDLRVHLASSSAFALAGVERPDFLNDLSFVPVIEQGRQRIRVSSRTPVREPYLNFVVELTRPGGQLLREYTLLLDPPAYQSAATEPVPAPETQHQTTPVGAIAIRAQVLVPRQAESGERYRIMPGDSLWTIAGRLGGSTTGSRQALMDDLFALNPNAFANADRNRIKVGSELILPDHAAPSAQPEPSQPQVAAPRTPPVGQPASAAPVEPAVVAAPAGMPRSPDGEVIEVLQQLEAQVLSLQAQMDAQNRLLAEAQERLAQRQAGADAITRIEPAPAPARRDAPVPAEPELQSAVNAVSPAVAANPAGVWPLPALILLGLLAGWLVYRRRSTATPAPSEPRAAQAKRAEASFPDINPFHSQVLEVTEMSLDEYLDTPTRQGPYVTVPATQLLEELAVSLPDDLDSPAATPESLELQHHLNEALGCIDRGEVERASGLLVALLDRGAEDHRNVSTVLARTA